MKPQIKRFQTNNEYFFVEGCYINELSNHLEDSELSIARARVEPGVTTQWHQLKETTERYVILEGKGVVEIGDMAPQNVQMGDVVIIPACTRQRITNICNEDLVFLALCTPRFETDNYQSV
ncbi:MULTISPECIES: cupin domain-containing protein [unclassified Methylophaga]|uniref:cupin domain-containing protein n=1 Tax=unclassified Methylophaga TaxID=2629249 RepID=UPI000C5FD885|nr:MULTISPECIES: cupin domain-containing protein [unclassified Methylophaga]MAL49337.1 cupin [Methylophaga sp.]MBP23665.1 cupin [Methylophaga sp.]